MGGLTHVVRNDSFARTTGQPPSTPIPYGAMKRILEKLQNNNIIEFKLVGRIS